MTQKTINDLEVEFLHGVPVKLPPRAKSQLRELFKTALEEVVGEDGQVAGYIRPNGHPSVDLTESYHNELRAQQRQSIPKILDKYFGGGSRMSEPITPEEVTQWCTGSLGTDFTAERLADILNKDYPLDEAIEDILSFRPAQKDNTEEDEI